MRQVELHTQWQEWLEWQAKHQPDKALYELWIEQTKERQQYWLFLEKAHHTSLPEWRLALLQFLRKRIGEHAYWKGWHPDMLPGDLPQAPSPKTLKARNPALVTTIDWKVSSDYHAR